MKATYRAVYDKDPETGQWMADVPEVSGCHTFGRTLDSARKNVFEAIAVCLDTEPDTFDVIDEVRLPEDVAKLHNLAEDAASASAFFQEAAAGASREAAALLHASGWNLRDAGKGLGVSYQRVHQLLGDVSPEVPAEDAFGIAMGRLLGFGNDVDPDEVQERLSELIVRLVGDIAPPTAEAGVVDDELLRSR